MYANYEYGVRLIVDPSNCINTNYSSMEESYFP